MRLSAFLIQLVSFIACSGAIAQEHANATSALDTLRTANPKVKWDKTTTVVADVTCDGRVDTAVVGYEKDKVWLGVVPNPVGKGSRIPMTVRFLAGKHSQDSFCAVPVRIDVYPIECESEDGALPGCKQLKGCSGFSLVDEACDSFHFYWDSSRGSLTWWRR